MKSVPKPLVVRFGDMCRMLGIGTTKGYELINSGEVESYLDGSARMVVVASLEAYVERKRAEATALPRKKHVESARRRLAAANPAPTAA